jgi:hypothetical protein
MSSGLPGTPVRGIVGAAGCNLAVPISSSSLFCCCCCSSLSSICLASSGEGIGLRAPPLRKKVSGEKSYKEKNCSILHCHRFRIGVVEANLKLNVEPESK